MGQIEKQILEMVFPPGILKWFDIVSGEGEGKRVKIVLEEKNIPPLSEEERGKKVICGGFTDITVRDFPLRGKPVELIFRRRYWKVEGREKYLKREIDICAEGTQLEKEFALFLKERM